MGARIVPDAALNRRLIVWIALLASVTIWAASPSGGSPLFVVGTVSVFANDLIVAAALVMGSGELLRAAGSPKKSLARLVSRIVIAYLLYQFLLVIPVAMWIGKEPLTTVIRTMSPRFYWMLFPLFLTLFRDARMRRIASIAAIVAVVALTIWGAYLAATGGGGFYADTGEGVRYRIFGALAPPLFAWPLGLAVSGTLPLLASLALGALAVIGQTLTGFRSGLIAYGLATVTGLWASKRLSRLAVWLVPAGLIGAVVYLLWNPAASAVYGYTLNHLFDLGSRNAVDRFTRWGLAWQFFQTHPFNDFVWSWHRYLINLSQGLGYEPHNFVLEIATTEGIAGLVFYTSIVAAVVVTAWRRMRDDGEIRAVGCFLIAYLVFSAVNANWYAYSSMPVFVSAVAALAALAGAKVGDATLPIGSETRPASG